MKVAMISSRKLTVKDLGQCLPPNTTVIVSGGAKGVDTCAREYVLLHGIKLIEFKPDYARYGRKAAPLKRNITIIGNANLALAFWDGRSNGTMSVIENCKKMGVGVEVHLLNPENGNDCIA